MNKKQKKILMHTVGYTTAVGITLGATLPFALASKSSGWIGGTQKITFMSNVPNWLDKSFNEATYNGAKNYVGAKRINDESAKLGTRGVAFSDDGDSYIEPIKSLYNGGAETIVSSGFTVTNAATEVLSDKKYKDKKFVLIDNMGLYDETANPKAADIQGSTASFYFNSAEAGFFAGLAASVYVTDLIGEKEEKNVGMWGGTQIHTVYDWMSGFEQAINYFNVEILKTQLKLGAPTTKGINLLSGAENKGGIDYSVTADHENNTEAKYDMEDPASDTEVQLGNNWFSGGFDTTPSKGKNATDKKLDRMHKKNTDVIFPVAGPQTFLAMNSLKENKHAGAKIIGVDVDATVSSPDDKQWILGSGLKKMELATEAGLWYADTYLENYKGLKGDALDTAANAANDYTYSKIGKTMMEDVSTGGWLKGEDSTKNGDKALFQGTYTNGGVGFGAGANTDGALDAAWKKQQLYINTQLSLTGNNALTSFDEFMAHAHSQQTDGIESVSRTFVSDPTKKPITEGSTLAWIPDWTTYTRT